MYDPALLNQCTVLLTLKLWDVAFFKVKTLVLSLWSVPGGILEQKVI